jgi:hypothetical protein
MTKEQLETRLDFIEDLIERANPKSLPYLNRIYQKLMDRLVALDMSGKESENDEVSM